MVGSRSRVLREVVVCCSLDLALLGGVKRSCDFGFFCCSPVFLFSVGAALQREETPTG